MSAFENRAQTDTRTAGVLHHAGVHEINLGAGVVVPVLPQPAHAAQRARLQVSARARA
jgi:hypothetical protein